MASHGLWHPQVDVDYNALETRIRISTGGYRPTRNDPVLDAMNTISDVWPQPPYRRLHVFVDLPRDSSIRDDPMS